MHFVGGGVMRVGERFVCFLPVGQEFLRFSFLWLLIWYVSEHFRQRKSNALVFATACWRLSASHAAQ
jgi:hypothetical protein